MPRHVYLSVGDNRLLLDLNDAAQVAELRSEVRRLREGGHVTLQEALPSPDQAWATGPGGHFVTELMVPLVLRKPRRRIPDPSHHTLGPVRLGRRIGCARPAASGCSPSCTVLTLSRMT